MEGLKCEKCGALNHVGARFCVKCGDRFELSHPLESGSFIMENPIENERKEVVGDDVTFTQVKAKIVDRDEAVREKEKVQENIIIEQTEDYERPPKRRLSVITICIIVILCISFVSLGGIGLYSNLKGDVEVAKDSVVMLEIYNKSNELIATGSGFCVYDSNTIATNFHVVEGAYKIVIVKDDKTKTKVDKVLVFNEKWDLALIQGNFNLVPLVISNNPVLRAGQKVTTIGSPMGELNTVSQGIISNADDDFDIRIDAPISHGSSGGVLLDKQYHVIGITYAGYDNAQNLNKAINVKYLKELYEAYSSGNYTSITKTNCEKLAGNLDSLDTNGFSKTKIYSPASFEVLYNITDLRARFETIIKRDNSEWLTLYNSMSNEAKENAIATLEYLNEKRFNYNYTAQDVSNWNIEQFFIESLILKKYELAFATALIQESNSLDEEVDNIDKLPIELGAKLIVLQVLGDYEYNFAQGTTAETIYNYVVKTCPNARDKILELLGFVIKYNNDGTFTTYTNK